ncbi:family 43 glycosylhydrolase [Gracilibacillus salitolerans]|uniref:Family 43 glycosylhydrolase n=1 Tax=Gracilibacillus salitolerans TaxID=2663022 RepID=A0A5Q2TIQ0_9BACI|nr:glycoside hydrolase family 43 protein [Gracilibacillus salitolerans]QGH34001.1 family 43 glycosylhydrolase [Gracilibacillus salitolerans]
MIQNPILKGFNPDPSIVRVDEDYYIATSTFEWFPGVRIHHSRDLKHWRLLTYPLTRTSQLNLKGNPSSGGIWAPNLTYADGVFYLVYTDVKTKEGPYKDCHNYLVTATNIEGPWSDPIFLNSSGFDPALFHDEDGRKWLINMEWNYRKREKNFNGILLQEYNPKQEKLTGPISKIIEGEEHVLEGSNLYKKDDYYYIILADGGTGYNHSVSVRRSKNIEGPFHQDPMLQILTARNHPDHPIQRAGHGSLVETQNGEWYMAYLCARPLSNKECPLGRETAIQKCYWTNDGWLRMVEGGGLPTSKTEAPNLREHPFKLLPEKIDFDEEQLPQYYQSLRVPVTEDWASLRDRKGFLRLYGRESLSSVHEQSLIARSIDEYFVEIETAVEFEPATFMQKAGLICMFDEDDLFYLHISYDNNLGKILQIIKHEQGNYDELLEDPIPIHIQSEINMKVMISREWLQFYYHFGKTEWQEIGPPLPFGNLGDEYSGKLGFTGAFVGICCQDLSGQRKYADFDYINYYYK